MGAIISFFQEEFLEKANIKYIIQADPIGLTLVSTKEQAGNKWKQASKIPIRH